MKTMIHPEVYGGDGRGGFVLLEGVELLDQWEGGCLIRTETLLPDGPADTCYVLEGNVLVALRFPYPPKGNGPYDYAAEKDHSDIRVVPVF